MPWQPPALEATESNNEDATAAAADEEHAAHSAKKKLLDDIVSRRLAANDGTPSVKDERRCDFEIITVPLRRKKVEAKPVVVAEEPETDDLSGHLDAWEHSWRGDLKLHKKRIMHEIWTDPRDPAMGRMLALQNITQVHGQNLMEKIHHAMDAIGDALFTTMRAAYVKTYQNGMFTTDQTITRLLSSFKIEVRTVLTADAVRQKVLLECMEQLFGSSEQHMGAGMTLHRFKLEAMDHYLEAQRVASAAAPTARNDRAPTAVGLPSSPHVTMSRAAKERKFQILCDQVEDFAWTTQSHMLTYCGMNSTDSLAHLRKILLLLCRLPSLELVPLPFKAEMAKATTLHRLQPGDVIATKDVVSPHIYLVVHGRVDCESDGATSSLQKDAAMDWIVGGDMDVLVSRPGGVTITAASSDVEVATLSKLDVEAILRQSFHPTSLLDKHGKFKAAAMPHHQRLAVKPKPPPSSSAGTAAHPRSIAQIVKVAKALPRHQRDRIKRTRCTESKLFSESYIRTQKEARKTAAAAIQRADDDDAATAVDASMDEGNEASDDDDQTTDPERRVSSALLAPRKLSTKSDASLTGRPKTAGASMSSPAFEFFPTFPDRFDTTQLDVLFMPSIPFPMDEMRLTDIGPPCPDAPSFVMPPRVQIDTAVLLLDQLQLLCKTHAPSTGLRDKRRHSTDSQASTSSTLQHNAPLVFHVHHDSTADEASLLSLAPLTLQQFIDGRKTVTAAAVKGQKVPFASVSLYCVDWNQPLGDIVVDDAEAPATAAAADDDAWLQVVSGAMGGTADTPGTSENERSRADLVGSESTGSLRRSSSRRQSIAGVDKKDTAEGGDKTSRRKQSRGGRRRSSRAPTDGASNAGVDPDELENSDSVSDLAPLKDRVSIADGPVSAQRSFLTEFDDPIDTPPGETSDNPDNKHLFKVESKRQLPVKPVATSRRRLLASEPSRAQSQSRRDVYRKVIRQVSSLDPPVEHDPTLHLKQLEIEQKLQDEIGKAMLEDGKPCPWRIKLQQRMESVLSALQLTARKKLAVVMKYTSIKHSPNLEAALDLWEKAANCIMDREATLQRVYEFELVASDPRRLFQTISTLRLKEQRQRDRLFLLLNNHTDFCKKVLDDLVTKFGDVVFYQDRAYADKMQHDYTELLYELEQVRLRVYFGGVHPHVAPAAMTIAPQPGHITITDSTMTTTTTSPALLAPAVSAPGQVAAHRIPGSLSPRDEPILTQTNAPIHTMTSMAVNLRSTVESRGASEPRPAEAAPPADHPENADGYSGHLMDIVRERGDATLAALKAELRRKHLEELAAKAQAKLEAAQEKINRRRLPTRPPQPKPLQKSIQETLADLLGRVRPTPPSEEPPPSLQGVGLG